MLSKGSMEYEKEAKHRHTGGTRGLLCFFIYINVFAASSPCQIDGDFIYARKVNILVQWSML